MGPDVKDCTEELDCPVVTVEASPPEGWEDIGIPGIVICANPGAGPKKKEHPNKPPEDNTEGNPFTYEGTLEDIAELVDCLKNGACKASLTLAALLPDDVCVNPNWTPISFVPSAYKKATTICQYGYDEAEKCCDSMDRTVDNLCVDYGVELTLNEECTIDLDDYTYGDIIAESCTEL